MIIVAGRIYVYPGTRQEFLRRSQEAMTLARQNAACHDFVVAADPIEEDRVNIYEAWESEEALLRFRGSGPDDDLSSMIVRVEVAQSVVSSTRPAEA